VSDGATERLDDARSALSAGQWADASALFRSVVEHDDDPDAWFGLGVASFWLGETESAIRSWERAYAGHRRRSAHVPAVVTAVYVSLAQQMSLGNDAVARGWVGRASRLVERYRIDGVQGWVSLCRAHIDLDTGRATAAERWAREAYAAANAAGDVDLELCAMSELGAALVEEGHLGEGFELLDEAMAGALAGEGRDRDAVVLVACRSISACCRSGEVRRAIQWVRAADDFYQRNGSPHLYTTCRARLGAIHFAAGRWEQAEIELEAALRIGRAAEPAVHAETLATFAELRLAQGRSAEAERLLHGYEDHAAVVGPLARLHLARGEPSAAVVLLRRRLEGIDATSLESAALTELLVRAAIGAGDIGLASTWAARLAKDAAGTPELVHARAERARGLVARSEGDRAETVRHLGSAAMAFGRLALPYEAAQVRLEIAEVLADGEREAAIAEARIAIAAFDELGASRDADAAAALLRSLGARVARGERAGTTLTRRELEVLALLGEGLSNRQIGDRLFITRKTVEHHVASILAKVGLAGRAEAAAYAVRRMARDRASG
jgi:DNA-binding CsgD family transcriptional regulator/Tfp pilus assembly protein PilF